MGRKKTDRLTFFKMCTGTPHCGWLGQAWDAPASFKKALRCRMQVPENSGWRDLENKRETQQKGGVLCTAGLIKSGSVLGLKAHPWVISPPVTTHGALL